VAKVRIWIRKSNLAHREAYEVKTVEYVVRLVCSS